AQLARLRVLTVSGTKIGNDAVKTLLQFSALEAIDLSQTGITLKGVEQLVKAKRLRVLKLPGTAGGDAAIHALKSHPRLWQLDLSGSDITDRGVVDICNMKALRHLCLNQSQITDHGLKMLATSSSQIQTLHLWDNQAITDTGF